MMQIYFRVNLHLVVWKVRIACLQLCRLQRHASLMAA